MPIRGSAGAEGAARVLIIESDTERCARITQAFAREGYAVDAARTPREALLKARETPFRAAMINAHLEEGDGSELPSALKRIQPEIACVVINKRAYCPNPIEPRKMLALTRRLLRQQERSERDHTIAEHLQAGFLPPSLPRLEGWDVAAYYQPAIQPYRVGGDFYDLFLLPSGRVGLAVGDVTGKGLRAAVHTAMARNFLRAYAFENEDPAAVLARLDAALYAYTPDEVFVSLVFAVLDPADGRFLCANAGHEAPMLLEASGLCMRLCSHAMVLGIAPGSTCRVQSGQLDPGDLLLFYTDGASDAWGHCGASGTDRLEQVFRQAADKPARKIVHHLARAVQSAGPTRCTDDVCFLVMRRQGQ
jgi:serine phosphatase RsbU (regulator of sigma subunit)